MTSSQDRNKPTVGDFEQAKTKLDVMQRKMKEQESTIQHLSNQKHVLEKQKRQLLDLAETVKLSSSQNRVSVETDETVPEVIKIFSCSTQLSMKFSLLFNVKMPTDVGIITFMSKKNGILGLYEP